MSLLLIVVVGLKEFFIRCDSFGGLSRDVEEPREGSKSSESSSCVLMRDEGVLHLEDGRPRFFPIIIMERFLGMYFCMLN